MEIIQNEQNIYKVSIEEYSIQQKVMKMNKRRERFSMIFILMSNLQQIINNKKKMYLQQIMIQQYSQFGNNQRKCSQIYKIINNSTGNIILYLIRQQQQHSSFIIIFYNINISVIDQNIKMNHQKHIPNLPKQYSLYILGKNSNISQTVHNIKKNTKNTINTPQYKNKIDLIPKKIQIPTTLQVINLVGLLDIFIILSKQGNIYYSNKNGTIQKNQGIHNIIKIVSGEQHVLALDTNGQVYGWGNGSYGSLCCKDGGSSTPKAINFKSRIIDISCGKYNSFFITKDYQIFGCGSNIYGQLGLQLLKVYFTPVKIQTGSLKIVQIASGTEHTLWLTDKGEVYASGSGKGGRLGIKTCVDFNNKLDKVEIKQKIINISASNYSAALTSKGIIYVWGTSVFGFYKQPAIFYKKKKIINLILKQDKGYALTDEKQILVWGKNQCGQLGLTDSCVLKPHPIKYLGKNNKQIFATKNNGFFMCQQNIEKINNNQSMNDQKQLKSIEFEKKYFRLNEKTGFFDKLQTTQYSQSFKSGVLTQRKKQKQQENADTLFQRYISVQKMKQSKKIIKQLKNKNEESNDKLQKKSIDQERQFSIQNFRNKQMNKNIQRGILSQEGYNRRRQIQKQQNRQRIQKKMRKSVYEKDRIIEYNYSDRKGIENSDNRQIEKQENKDKVNINNRKQKKQNIRCNIGMGYKNKKHVIFMCDQNIYQSVKQGKAQQLNKIIKDQNIIQSNQIEQYKLRQQNIQQSILQLKQKQIVQLKQQIYKNNKQIQALNKQLLEKNQQINKIKSSNLKQIQSFQQQRVTQKLLIQSQNQKRIKKIQKQTKTILQLQIFKLYTKNQHQIQSLNSIIQNKLQSQSQQNRIIQNLKQTHQSQLQQFKNKLQYYQKQIQNLQLQIKIFLVNQEIKNTKIQTLQKKNIKIQNNLPYFKQQQYSINYYIKQLKNTQQKLQQITKKNNQYLQKIKNLNNQLIVVKGIMQNYKINQTEKNIQNYGLSIQNQKYKQCYISAQNKIQQDRIYKDRQTSLNSQKQKNIQLKKIIEGLQKKLQYRSNSQIQKILQEKNILIYQLRQKQQKIKQYQNSRDGSVQKILNQKKQFQNQKYKQIQILKQQNQGQKKEYQLIINKLKLQINCIKQQKNANKILSLQNINQINQQLNRKCYLLQNQLNLIQKNQLSQNFNHKKPRGQKTKEFLSQIQEKNKSISYYSASKDFDHIKF